MDIDVFLTSQGVSEEDVRGRTVVIIDVLRASSTILTALHHGARAVIPVPDMEEAGRIASNMDPSVYLLGGERKGDRIDGYHLGNSPLEYTEEQVTGKTIILNTTNGTVAIGRAEGAAYLTVGSFLNASAVVDFIREKEKDATLICAGHQQRASLEDTLCAGLLLDKLWNGERRGGISDTAHIAHTQYVQDVNTLQHTLRSGAHARALQSKGYEADVEYAVQQDSVPLVPDYIDNRLVAPPRASGGK